MLTSSGLFPEYHELYKIVNHESSLHSDRKQVLVNMQPFQNISDSRIANLQHQIFLSFLDDLVMVLEESEVIFYFSVIKQVQF